MDRKIYYVPMVHSPEELGSLKEAVVAAREKVFGKADTLRFIREVDGYWKLVTQRIVEAGLCRPEIASHLHIVIDGLPNVDNMDGGAEVLKKTVAHLIEQWIPVYLIIAELQKAGATVHGTENLELLLAERAYWKAIAAKERDSDPEWQKQSLEARDKAIIANTDRVVPDGGTAIVFVGRKHKVVELLTEPPYNFKFVNL